MIMHTAIPRHRSQLDNLIPVASGVLLLFCVSTRKYCIREGYVLQIFEVFVTKFMKCKMRSAYNQMKTVMEKSEPGTLFFPEDSFG